VIRLATQARAKPLHHVSTIGLLAPEDGTADVRFREDDVTPPERLHSGYAQSKWVAEELVRKAQSRGLRAVIYRPGGVSGHSRSGASNTTDFICRALKGWIQLGIAPDVDDPIDLTPVDYVASALSHLSRQESSFGKTFHLVNPRPASLRDLVEQARRFGYALMSLPLERFEAELARRVEQSPDNALFPLLTMMRTANPSGGQARAVSGIATYDCSEALAALEGSGVACPEIDATVLGHYFDALTRSGFLPLPNRTKAIVR
jgi:myxalamid-type nonribosomal peptide synthetase MxaA